MKKPVLLIALLAVACATTQPQQKTSVRSVGLTLDEARTIVADLEARQAAESADNPLHKPKSLGDVIEILKSDQIDLFAAGVTFAQSQKTPEADALASQIELAWGEALFILADVFSDVSGQMRRAIRELHVRAASGETTDAETRRLLDLEDMTARSHQLAEALNKLAAEHVGKGARLAKAVIEKNPDSYLGYRVAADFYRLRGDWVSFDRMIRKIEETRPDSNGLVFLKGTAALQRDNDAETARGYFTKALDKEKKFVRARVQMLLSHSGAKKRYTEYQKLRALNAQHQIVVWAGEAITAAFEALNQG